MHTHTRDGTLIRFLLLHIVKRLSDKLNNMSDEAARGICPSVYKACYTIKVSSTRRSVRTLSTDSSIGLSRILTQCGYFFSGCASQVFSKSIHFLWRTPLRTPLGPQADAVYLNEVA